MPRIGLKDLPFPDRLDPRSMISNLKTAWENFRNIDRYTTVSAVAGTTVLTAISQTIFANAAAGNIILTVPSATGNVGLTFTVFKTDSTTNTVTINGTVLGGNLGVSRLILVSNGTSYLTQELYEEGTYPATLTGCATSPTTTVSYTRNGKNITLRAAVAAGISNTTACTLTGMPSHLFPSATQSNIVVGSVVDNGLDHVGLVSISTAGVFTLAFYSAATTLTSTFTNAGTKGISGFVLGYIGS